MIEDEQESVAEPAEPELEPEAGPPPAKSAWKAFILTGLLAGLLGAAAGGYGAYEALTRLSPEPVPQAQVDLSPVQSRLDQISDRLTKVETAAREANAREIEPVDLSDLEVRLDALESAPNPEIDPGALTALRDAQADGFQWPDVSALETRLTALETAAETQSAPSVPTEVMDRIAALETEMETARNAEPVAMMDPEVMSDLTARLAELENRPPPKPVIERVSILAFPKAQMIEAVEDNQTGGMIEKALSRHIRVKDANDPLTLIDGIEADLSEGRLAAAAKKFERLPSDVQVAGQAWYESVKASL